MRKAVKKVAGDECGLTQSVTRSARRGQRRENPFIDQFIDQFVDRSAVETEFAVDIDEIGAGANSRITIWKIRISSEVVECYIETTLPENG